MGQDRVCKHEARADRLSPDRRYQTSCHELWVFLRDLPDARNSTSKLCCCLLWNILASLSIARIPSPCRPERTGLRQHIVSRAPGPTGRECLGSAESGNPKTPAQKLNQATFFPEGLRSPPYPHTITASPFYFALGDIKRSILLTVPESAGAEGKVRGED